jgi:hypothetical protein
LGDVFGVTARRLGCVPIGQAKVERNSGAERPRDKGAEAHG